MRRRRQSTGRARQIGSRFLHAGAVLAVVLGGTGCATEDPGIGAAPSASAGAPSPVASPSPSASPTLDATARLRPDGIGPVHVGMTLEDVAAVAGVPLERQDGPYCDALAGTASLEGLSFVDAADEPGLDFVSVDGRAVRTEAGIGIGSTVDEVTRAYAGIGLDGNEGPRRLTYRAPDGRHAIVFHVDGERVVHIDAGLNKSVLADEACA